MRALWMLCVLAVGAPAYADDTFETIAAGAQRVQRLEDIVWALTAKCDAGDDTQQRQCRRVRDNRATELRGATLVVDGDRDAFAVGAWSGAKKSAPITLTSCIRCAGVDVDGKKWFIAGTRPPNQAPRFQAGKQVGPLLEDTARTFPDEGSAKKYAANLASAKVDFVVRVPANPVWTDATRQGIGLEVLAYRVYSPCDGSVVAAKPKAGPGEIDRKACATGAGEVDALTPPMIKDAMRPVVDAAKACYAQHKQPGKARLRLTVAADGSIAEHRWEGDFGTGSATAMCLEDAVKLAVFPRSKKAQTPIAINISLP